MAWYPSVGWGVRQYGDPLVNDFLLNRESRRNERKVMRAKLYGDDRSIGTRQTTYNVRSDATKYENHFQMNREQRRSDRRNYRLGIENKDYVCRKTVDPYTTKYSF